MNKKFRNYNEAVQFGPAMSERNFSHHGAPGIDDEAPRDNPEEMRTEDGILVYRIDSNKLTICGYRHTPWIGETKIRLLQGFEKAKAGLEVMNGLGLEIDSPVKLSFW